MKNNYPITGTFIDEITYDIPSSNWTNEQWAKDLDNMKEVGMDTLIFIRGAFENKCIYPSKIFPSLKKDDEDFAGFIIEEAGKRDMKVFFGTYLSNLCWNDGDWVGEIKKNKLFIDEVYSRYGSMPAFYGWYIPQESGRNNFNLKETMAGIAALCKDKDPTKKVMISPFFYGNAEVPEPFTPERTVTEWANIWEKSGDDIDVCAFQDGSVTLENYRDFFGAMRPLCKEKNISLWSNVETFERDVRHLYFPISFDLLRRKLELAEGVTDKCITFEFSHFLSPQSIFPSARNLNNLYRNYYGKKR